MKKKEWEIRTESLPVNNEKIGETIENRIKYWQKLYFEEKKKNEKIENKLKYDINKLDGKIKEKASLYGERYNKTRLRGIRTKCKEILRFMEEI